MWRSPAVNQDAEGLEEATEKRTDRAERDIAREDEADRLVERRPTDEQQQEQWLQLQLLADVSASEAAPFVALRMAG